MRILIISLILIQSLGAMAAGSKKRAPTPEDVVDQAAGVNSKLNRINGSAPADCEKAMTPEDFGMKGVEVFKNGETFKQLDPPKVKGETVMIDDEYKRPVQVSVIDPAKACELFSELMINKKSEFRLDAVASGCEPRAHLTGIFLQDHQVQAGKLWFSGDFDPLINNKRGVAKWDYHVAAFVMVRSPSGKLEKWVFDPLIPVAKDCATRQPSPLEEQEYRKLLSAKPSSISSEVNNRFNYKLRDRSTRKSYYNGDENNLAKSEMQTIRSDLRDGKLGGRTLDKLTPN